MIIYFLFFLLYKYALSGELVSMNAWHHVAFVYRSDDDVKWFINGNLVRSKSLYPAVPAVFYTRKSLIRDAVAMFKAGADGLFIKPTGENDNETRRLTREYAPQLITELKEIVYSKAGAE